MRWHGSLTDRADLPPVEADSSQAEQGTQHLHHAVLGRAAPLGRDGEVRDEHVAGVDAAVARILAHADRSAWEAGSATARQDVRDHLDTQDTLRRLAAVALDRPDIPS